MWVIDFTLNLCGLLLWLGWRSAHIDPLANSTPVTLVSTLKRAHPRRWKGWQYLAGLLCLLFLRGLLYWQLGSPAGWTPQLNLGVVVLAFKGDQPAPALLFSLLSFARVFFVFYSWLLALNLINRGLAEKDPILKVIQLHLGHVGRWPWFVLVLLPLVSVMVTWALLHPLLLRLEVVTASAGINYVLAQSALLAGALLVTLKFILPVILFLHLLSSYVYLGNNAAWDFMGNTARGLLLPLRRLPLRSAKVDFAPLAGIILLFLLLHALPQYLLAAAQRAGISVWPQ